MAYKPYKGRSIADGQLVKVYRNLHRGGYSIADVVTGVVLAHADDVLLTLAQFKVNEGGRQRVLREKQKNVHAYVIGTYRGAGEAQANRVRYNPYETETFVTEHCEAIYRAGVVHLGSEGVTYSIRY